MQAMSPATSSPVPVAGKAIAMKPQGDGSREFSDELKAAETFVGNEKSSGAGDKENSTKLPVGEDVETKVTLDEDLELLAEKLDTQTEDQQAIPAKNQDVLQQFILKTNKKFSLAEGAGDPKPEGAVSKPLDVLVEKKNTPLEAKPQSTETSKPVSMNPEPSTDDTGMVEEQEPKPNSKSDKSIDVEPKIKTEVSTPTNPAVNAKSVDTVQPVLQPVSASQASQLSPPAKSILTAIQENSNWSKQLSSPVLQTVTQVQNSGAVLQSLQVQLHPVELGSVNLKLRLVQGQMQVEVAVENDAAYKALVADQDGLMNTVRAMGFKVESLSISNGNGQSSLMGQDKSENDGAESGSSGGSDDANIENEVGRDTSSDSASGIDGQSHVYI